MSNEEIKTIISELLPNASFEEGGEWLNIGIESSDWNEAAQKLKSCAAVPFNFLFCLTCVDWKTHFTMVYHLRSTSTLDNIVVKVKLDRVLPEVITVSDIWLGAELFEREVYDLFGVIFLEHPDLRRLLLTDDWVGYPLRKDYEDPINMIKL
jgi:NADH:ubiquinone oxidoreductase subunit C